MLALGVTWYLLPSIQNTQLGELLLSLVSEQIVFITTICLIPAALFFGIMGKVFNIVKSSKANNFYTHLISWLLALVLIAVSGYAFVASGDVLTTEIELNVVRRIGILTCSAALLLYSLLAPKIRVLVDRRIQAYDTAKELNADGRSSVVGMQILKCLDFVCPELFLLIALCFAFDIQISLYFIYIIVAFVLPVVGNMICDKRVKKESKINKIQEQEALVNEVANAVASQIQSNNNSIVSEDKQ